MLNKSLIECLEQIEKISHKHMFSDSFIEEQRKKIEVARKIRKAIEENTRQFSSIIEETNLLVEKELKEELGFWAAYNFTPSGIIQ